MDFIIDILCVLFFVVTGYACIYYVMDNWRPTTFYRTGRKYWQHRILEIVVAIIGAWHLLYALVQLFNLVLWSLMT